MARHPLVFNMLVVLLLAASCLSGECHCHGFGRRRLGRLVFFNFAAVCDYTTNVRLILYKFCVNPLVARVGRCRSVGR